MRKVVLIGLVLVAVSSAQAYTYNWVGGTGGDWNVGSNWKSNTVPTATDGTILTNGSAYLTSATNSVGNVVMVNAANRTSSMYLNNAKLTTTGIVQVANGNAHNSVGYISMTNSELVLTTTSISGALTLGGSGTNQTVTMNMKDSKVSGGYLYVGGGATDAKANLIMNNSTGTMGQTTFAGGARTLSTVVLTNNSSFTSSGTIFMGNAANASANVMVGGGSILQAANYSMAAAANSTTTVSAVNSSSTLKITGSAQVALGTSSKADMNVSSGALLDANVLNVSVGTTATGTVNVIAANLKAGSTVIGWGTNSIGIVNIDSGSSATSGLTRVGYYGQGTLGLNGSSLSTGTNALDIASLSGNGSVMVSNGATLSVGAALALATGAGNALFEVSGANNTISVNNVDAQNNRATFAFSVLDMNGFSTVTATGDILIDNSVLNIDLNGYNLADLNNLILFTGNSVTGTFSSVLIDGLDGSSKVVYGADYITLIPEPATFGLLLFSALGLFGFRRMTRA